ncbi:MAG: DUF5666 domain-containing protein [bacterium]|nr:DUF5666 domain-containing protein [bacterium]
MKAFAIGVAATLCLAARGGPDSVQGRITLIDPAAGILEISGVRIIAKDAVVENLADQRVTLADLKAGDSVDVDGSFSGPGEMTAVKIEQEVSVTDEVEGKIAAVDAAGGTITIGGVTVKVPAGAVIEDGNDMPTALEQLKTGSRVDCEGTWTGDRELTAVKIEID